MIKDNELTFNKFYIVEFLREVLRQTPDRLSGENSELVKELIDHLNKKEDVTDGIETIAREQGSGELSIFLFDIVDRIEDYPPTVAYDALPDIVDDFVSGLDLMLEEEETVQAIKNVNQQFREESGTPAEIPAEKPVAETVDQDTSDQEDKPESEITEEISIPAPQEPEIDFEEYFEIEFNDKVRDYLDKNIETKLKSELAEFHRLLIENVSRTIEQPAVLEDLLNILRSALPWKTGESYSASVLIGQEEKYLKKYTKDLEKLAREHAELIANSVQERKIILPEPEPEPEPEETLAEIEEKAEQRVEEEVTQERAFIPEEIPEKPTTIDAILSEYFQSEVDEHVERLKENIGNLKSNLESVKVLKDLVSNFQSFNEISMIHGYVLIESFCTRMIDLFSFAAKEKMQADPDALSHFDKLSELLQKTENLKDAKKKTDASENLDQIADQLEASLFTEKKSAKAIKKEPAKKVEPERESEKVKEPVEDHLINIKNKEALTSILREILDFDRTEIIAAISGETDPKYAVSLLSRLEYAANLIDLKNLASVFALFKSEFEDEPLPSPQQLETVFNEFIKNFSSEPDVQEWKEKIKTEPAAEEVIKSDNTQQLLKIIADIEEINLNDFSQHLDGIFKDQNQEVIRKIHKKFILLEQNLELVNRADMAEFARYYSSMISPVVEIPVADNSQQAELVQSYKLFIQSLRSDGKGVDIKELISILEELFTKEKSAEVPVKEEAAEVEELAERELIAEPVEGAVEPEDEGEEDLLEVFKQETDLALQKINEALALLEKNPQESEHYRPIERNVHSIKSSARLMGMNDVADLAAPLEEICEKMASGSYKTDDDNLALIKEAVQVLHGAVKGEQADTAGLIKKIRDIKIVALADIPESTAKQQEAETKEADKPLFTADAAEDDDLLVIFKEESAEFIKMLEEAVAGLKEKPDDPELAKMLENASHSLKSPAKMLGFSEIGRYGDVIENIAEAVLKHDLKLSRAAVQKVGEAINAIKTLSAGGKLAPDIMTSMFTELDPEQLKLLADEEPEQGEEPVDEDSVRVFLEEAKDLLEKINHCLVGLEKNPEDKSLVADLSRSLHTLKGSAQIMGQKKIGDLAHAIEDILAFLKENNQTVPERTFDIVFRAVDGIQKLTDEISQGKDDSDGTYQKLLLSLSNELETLKQNQKTGESVSAIRPVQIEKAPEVSAEPERTIKITTDRLDNFVNMAAELVINKTQLSDQLEKLREIREIIEGDREKLKKAGSELSLVLEQKSGDGEKKSSGKLPEKFEDILNNLDELSFKVSQITLKFDQNLNQIAHLSKSLHDDILQVRMVPTEVLFNRFPRAVRDMAKKQKKKINLLVEGEDTEMDRAMVEALTDPVMHLIRNAIDHGIELPKERKENKKSEDGIILLKARRDKNQVIIEVQDDGRGIDVAAIKAIIEKQHIIEKSEIEKLNDEEIIDYIFHPGFTTKKTVSDVSGRGVGLDAVAAEIQNLKGDIRVSSTVNKGTIFSIRLPLTLAITQSLLVEVNKEMLAVPINSIEETQDFEENKVVTKDKKKYLKVRREEIPLVDLADFIQYDKKNESDGAGNIIIIQDRNVRYGLIVDKAVRREEIVVRSLGDELNHMDNIAGGTIFGDGSVVLILDIPAITRKIESEYFEGQRDFSSLESARQILTDADKKPSRKKRSTRAAKKKTQAEQVEQKKIAERKPSALIIDDSLSVRKFVSSVLERNNYNTTLAEDGPEALEELNAAEFDIIITDLEMPKMQGFELIEKIRERDNLKEVPIVILTGKAAKENKDKGMKLGANAYIIKPFKENDLLHTLEQFIKI